MKSGFALLSVMISIVLGTILLGSTFMMYNNIARTSRFVQRVSEEDTREVVVINRMQKDFLGIATMWNSDQSQDDDQSSITSQQGNMENQYFYSVNDGKKLDYLTFITTATLSSYVSDNANFIRVMYRLEPEKDRQDLYRLLRKEISKVSKVISDDDIQGGSFSELADGIRSVNMHYYYFKKSSGDVTGQDLEDGSSIQELSDWNPDNEATKEQTKNSVPYAVKVDITFVDNNDQEYKASFRVDIVSDLSINVAVPKKRSKDIKSKSSSGVSNEQK